MKILHVNKFAFPKGGAEEYMFGLARRQKLSGATVAIFGGTHGQVKRPSDLDFFDFEVRDFHAKLSLLEKGSTFSEVMWNRRAQDSLRNAVNLFNPDVIHLHNYSHQLSSSILAEDVTRGIKVVHTAHDYKLICPAYVANIKGKDCFACAQKVSIKLVVEKCHQGNLAWSAAVALEARVARDQRLQKFSIVAPSKFMFESLRDSWLSDRVIHLLRNPAESSGVAWTGGSEALLYVGRLSREKGVETLIEAAGELGLELWIAGDGPLRLELENISQGRHVKFFGHLDSSELQLLRKKCLAQVIPSEWPENAPLSAIEALVDGVPVIAANRGGMPEYSELGGKLALVDKISAQEIFEALESLRSIKGDIECLRQELSWGTHLQSLEKIYRE